VGDILLASGVAGAAADNGAERLFASVEQLLRGDDLTIGNLECAVATCGTPAAKQFTFRASPALLPGLRRGGVDAVSLANNHALDYGRAALLETLDHLRRVGIQAAGAGPDMDHASRPAFLCAGRQTVALIAASRVLPTAEWGAGEDRPGIAGAYAPSRLLHEIRAARPAADVVVAYLHWGREHAPLPQATQRALARQCIEAGADLVIGAHPHVLQGFEYYRGKLVAYSLGNFVFTDHGKATALLQTTFRQGALQAATVVPCRIVHYRPRVITDPAQREAVLRDLQARSFGVRISGDGELTCGTAAPGCVGDARL
jgi:poly-gamma-glutamate synthesis protein (capsule biosynthesis protein)